MKYSVLTYGLTSRPPYGISLHYYDQLLFHFASISSMNMD